MDSQLVNGSGFEMQKSSKNVVREKYELKKYIVEDVLLYKVKNGEIINETHKVREYDREGNRLKSNKVCGK
jgi:hypothetical protein